MRALLPRDATGHIFAGALLARLGRLEEAEAMHRAGTGFVEGAVDEAWYNLGLVLRGQERHAEAAAAFERAVALDPADREYRRALDDMRAALALDAAT
jgi:tetratricopeptide (TPR) repeat protein